ncbi:MAG: YegS/Rv2252/BmrU family lipid kinase [Bacteroidales bacterium]|nr:YegS/Rv2252/BmrU family lipid kinase [Bacteroidales bacterium]
MKHIFVINPSAGKADATADLTNRLHSLDGRVDYAIHITSAPGDATQYVKQLCHQEPTEEFRFYACGGDGTINEVVSGIVGSTNAQITCYPCGSGNDYIKYYAKRDDFLDIDRLVSGTPHRVDLMKLGNRYSLNCCNIGFEAEVCRHMEHVKRKPIIGGNNAYTTGILAALATGRHNRCQITIDGQPFHDGPLLLCSFANGQYVGGAYRCAPRSQNDDGLLDICLVSPTTIVRFAKLINIYRAGNHLDDPSCTDLMHYRRGRVVEISAAQPIHLVADGELISADHFCIENLHQAITFVSPAER